MESAAKIKMIKQTINELMEDVGSDDDDDHRHRHRHRHRLSKLISQLESLEGDAAADDDNISSCSRLNEEKILKEVEKLRRQNVITHCLLSVMIVLTVAWQISEVSIILKLKNGVTHPFRSIGSIFKAMIKPRQLKDDLSLPEISSVPSDPTPVCDLKLPLPNLPKIDFGFQGQD